MNKKLAWFVASIGTGIVFTITLGMLLFALDSESIIIFAFYSPWFFIACPAFFLILSEFYSVTPGAACNAIIPARSS
jgi:hypothetical protein